MGRMHNEPILAPATIALNNNRGKTPRFYTWLTDREVRKLRNWPLFNRNR
jgi:hypothetical protein